MNEQVALLLALLCAGFAGAALRDAFSRKRHAPSVPDKPPACEQCGARSYIVNRIEAELARTRDDAGRRERELLERNEALLEIVRGQVRQIAELAGVQRSLRAVDPPPPPAPADREPLVAAGMQGGDVPMNVRLKDVKRRLGPDEQAYLERVATGKTPGGRPIGPQPQQDDAGVSTTGPA